MTQTLELNKMGLVPLNEDEMMDVIGGGFWKWVAETFGAWILKGIPSCT